jgi:hypothetical protein
MTLENAYVHTLPTISTGWASFTHIQIFPAATIEAADKIKLTLEAPSNSNVYVSEMFIGNRGGSFGFNAAPVQVTVGSNTSFTIPQGTTIETDLIIFDYDALYDLVVATSFTSAPQNMAVSFNAGSGTSYYFRQVLNDAGTINKTGYSAAGSNPNALGLVTSIDVERPAPVEPPVYPAFTYVRDDTITAPWPIELVAAVDPIWNYNNYIDRAGLWRRFAHVFVPDVQEGDVITTLFSFEGTNPNGYAVEFVCGLVLTPTASGTAGCEAMPSVSGSYEPSGGRLMSRMPGYNVTPALDQFNNIWHGMHHGMFTINTAYTVPAGISGDRYVAAIGYAAGSSYTQSGDKFDIEPYCGDMSVNIKRKVFL